MFRRLGFGFWVAVGWIAIVVLSAALANWLPLPSPFRTGDPDLPPTAAHLLGTDDLGRDILARIVFGARVSVTVGLVSMAVQIVVGGGIGLATGYYRGKIDSVASIFTDVMLAFPTMVIALAFVAFVGPSLFSIVLITAAIGVAPTARLVRAVTLSVSERNFVLSARVIGAKNGRIIVREILPNVVPVLVAFSLVGVGFVIVVEGSLAFLGLSVQPPTPSWGTMINEGRDVLITSPGVSLWPAAAMFLFVLALNVAGEKLRGHFDVREGAL